MDKETAKKAVEALAEKFREAEASGALKRYTEEETKKNFILPLFRALGWDVDGPEVSAEETISGGRVDYGFYLDGRAQFYVEAKAARENTDQQKFADQAIGYSWNKGVTWAVLTNFKLLEIFNAEDATATIFAKRVMMLRWDEYVENFDDLWLLSKEAFREKRLDAYAEKIGKKLKRVSVTTKLVEDLNEARELLSRMFITWNPKLELAKNPQLLDEGVQRVLDRIIFIRVAEDRGIEAPTLQPIVRTWEANWRAGKREYLYQSMEKKFRELDGIYNSNIFAKHPSDDWVDEKNSLEGIVDKFYGKPGYYSYDFKIIPADILGTVYEQYLGHRLAKLEKGDLFGESDLGVAKDARKRKEQGIYYTPRFIVDYIVESALGPVLEKCTSIADLQKIKVLDPACGSGSFLIKALELIYAKYKDFGAEGEEVKLQILTNNLYGVDLDEQAVEIARLNLLVASLEKRQKLPNLTNIRNGNSLISGTDEDLKKRFGKDWRDKKPFNWEKEFPEVFAQGGFDVVIGNPPYVNSRELSDEDKEFFGANYKTASDQYDLYTLFVERALNVLKVGGRFGFIMPNKFLITRYGLALRKLVAQNTKIESIRDYSDQNVFKDASVYPVVLIFEKEQTKQIVDDKSDFDLSKFASSSSTDPILEKLSMVKATPFSVWRPLATSKDVLAGKEIVISNREISRYAFDTTNKGSLKNARERDHQKNKILLKKLCYNLEASLDNKGYYPINTTYCIAVPPKGVSLFYILAVLNSKLLTYYVRRKYKDTALRGGFIELRVFQVASLPIAIPTKEAETRIAMVAKEILALNKALQELAEHSEKWNKLKTEIERTNKEIDQEVYKLYGLTDEDVALIESATKT